MSPEHLAEGDRPSQNWSIERADPAPSCLSIRESLDAGGGSACEGHPQESHL